MSERGNANYDEDGTMDASDADGIFGRQGRHHSDLDLDGDVDGTDFLIWQTGFGSGSAFGEGDTDFDSDVDGDDFLVWQGEFGSQQPAEVDPGVSFRIHQSTEIADAETIYHSGDEMDPALRPQLTVTQYPDLELIRFDSDGQGLKIAYNVRFGDFTSASTSASIARSTA